ncbi:MAG TPA: hypothetical protein PLK84_02205, partial [Syntrophales bacterium]|nr:hypothetical protein [Syntrophales bacterium]
MLPPERAEGLRRAAYGNYRILSFAVRLSPFALCQFLCQFAEPARGQTVLLAHRLHDLEVGLEGAL